MKFSKKLLGIFSSLTILIAGIAVPQMLSTVAATQTNDRYYDSGEDKNAAYELDLAARKNFYLTFKLKYTFPGETVEGWQGAYVSVREGIKAKIAYGFIGNEGKNWNGAWTDEASKWTDKWLDVGIRVHDNDLTITVAGEPVAGGIQAYQSTLEDNVTPSKITIGGATCQFQLDDILVLDEAHAGDLTAGLSGTTLFSEDFAEETSTYFDGGDNTNASYTVDLAARKNYFLTFKAQYAFGETLQGWEGLFVKVREGVDAKVAAGHIGNQVAGDNAAYNMAWTDAAKAWTNQWLNIGVRVYEDDLTIIVMGAPVPGGLQVYQSKLNDKNGAAMSTPCQIVIGGATCTIKLDDICVKEAFALKNMSAGLTGTALYTNNFEVPIYSVTAASDNETMGTVTGGGDILSEDTVTVKATAKEGYRFVKWVDAAGADVSTDAEYTFTPTADIALKAIFTGEATYAVTVTADSAAHGTVTGAGNVVKGQTATVKATPNSGYAFVNWVDATGAEVSKDAEYTFTPTGDIALTAKFEKVLFTEVDADFEDAADLELFNNDKNLLSIVADPQKATNKVLKFHASGDNWGEAMTKATNYDNFELTAKILWSAAEISGSGNFSIKGRLSSESQDGCLSCELSNWKSQFGVIKDNANSSGYLDYALTPDQWTQLKLVVNGNKAEVYLDGALKATYEGDIPMNATGAISLGSWTDGNIVVYLDNLKIVNLKEEEEKPEDKTFTDVDVDFEDAADMDLFDDEKGLLSIVADPQKASNKVLKFHASASNWGEARTKANNYDNFVLTAKIMWGSTSGGAGNFGIRARNQLATMDGSLSCELSTWMSQFGVIKDNTNSSGYLGFALEADKWTQLKLVVKDNKAEVYLDGVLKASYAGELVMNKAGYITLNSWTDGDVVVYLDDLRVAHADGGSPATGSNSVLPCAAAALALSGAALIFCRRKKNARG